MSDIPDKDFLKYLKDKTGSDSFCLAKWYNATIWLGSGMTTSCHHPPAHKIPLEGLDDNPKLIHNTPEKKEDRRQMRCGERPKGCEYCWKIEDLSEKNVSDRVYKSKIYSEQDLQAAMNTSVNDDVNLKTLEISFDRTCNLACSYCNPAFSTTWVKDIKKNGPYEGLISDGRNHFTHTHDASQLYKVGETNPYVEAFLKWWETDLKDSLDEIRITGGEPLMSGEFWKFLDLYKKTADDLQLNAFSNLSTVRKPPRLAINTNLMSSDEKFSEFIRYINVPEVHIYTSCEATDKQAEYIRDGLDYNMWYNRMIYLIMESKRNRLSHKQVHVMCTINALCLFSLPELLDDFLDIKKLYKENNTPTFTLNILRFPSFQSPLVLPKELRDQCRSRLEYWVWKNADPQYIQQHEIEHINRLIEYLEHATSPHSEAFELPKLRQDFKNFYTQYDKRRGKSFEDTFPKELVDWFKSL